MREARARLAAGDTWVYKRARTLAKILLTAVLGLVIGLVVGETIVRAYFPQRTGPAFFTLDPELGPIPRPGITTRYDEPGVFSLTCTHNSQGLRSEVEYTREKRADRRILVLGDSFTYGWGVDEDQTFCHLVERMMRERSPETEVVNAGNPGKGTDYALKFFRTKAADIKPDLTILCFFTNDFKENLLQHYYIMQPSGELTERNVDREVSALKSRFWTSDLYNFMLRHSHLANLARKASFRALKGPDERINRRKVDQLREDTAADHDADRSFDLTRVLVENLASDVRESGSDFMLFYFPSVGEVQQFSNGGGQGQRERWFEEITSLAGLEAYSVTDWLSSSPFDPRRLYFSDGHWTPLGHFLAAQYMHSVIAGDGPRQLEIAASEALPSSTAAAPMSNREQATVTAGS